MKTKFRKIYLGPIILTVAILLACVIIVILLEKLNKDDESTLALLFVSLIFSLTAIGVWYGVLLTRSLKRAEKKPIDGKVYIRDKTRSSVSAPVSIYDTLFPYGMRVASAKEADYILKIKWWSDTIGTYVTERGSNTGVSGSSWRCRIRILNLHPEYSDEHVAGEQLFVRSSAQRVSVTDSKTWIFHTGGGWPTDELINYIKSRIVGGTDH